MLREDFDSISLTSRLLHTQKDLSEMSLAEPLKEGVLLQEGARGSTARVAEYKAALVHNGNLVLFC